MKKKTKFGKKIVRILDIHPYSQQLVLIVNGQFSDALKVFKKHKNRNAIDNVKHIEENLEDYLKAKEYNISSLYTELPHSYVMLVDHRDSWIETVGHIVHESTHLTHYVLRRAGIELTKESEEAFTYLTEKTVEDILRIMY